MDELLHSSLALLALIPLVSYSCSRLATLRWVRWTNPFVAMLAYYTYCGGILLALTPVILTPGDSSPSSPAIASTIAGLIASALGILPGLTRPDTQKESNETRRYV